MCHQLSALNARIDGLTKLIADHPRLDANARLFMHIPVTLTIHL